MPMLTQTDLDSMRLDFEESLPDECTIYRKEYTDDGQGGQVETQDSPRQVGTFKARLSPMGPMLAGWHMETVVAARLMGRVGWYLTMPYATPFELSDTAQVIFLESMEVKTLEIIGTMDNRTYQLGTRLACAELT
jgi:hypothetical protein